MNITITLNTDNAAFDTYAGNNDGIAAAKILEKVLFRMRGSGGLVPVNYNLMDVNGNTVGKVLIEES